MISFPQTFRSRKRTVLVCATICWTGFAAVVLAVHTGHAEALDSMGLLFWRDDTLRPLGSTRLLETVRDVTALGGVLLRNVFAAGCVVALLFMGLRREAVLLTLTVATGWLVNSLIKNIVGRDRPDIVPHLMEVGGHSFPSGHSFNSAIVYISAALAFAALTRRASVRATLIGAAMVTSLAIAWSRVWLGVHWPTDVSAGWLGGAGWAFLANALLHRTATITVATVDEIHEGGTPDSEARQRR